jgi:hypothetical protein
MLRTADVLGSPGKQHLATSIFALEADFRIVFKPFKSVPSISSLKIWIQN